MKRVSAAVAIKGAVLQLQNKYLRREKAPRDKCKYHIVCPSIRRIILDEKSDIRLCRHTYKTDQHLGTEREHKKVLTFLRRT